MRKISLKDLFSFRSCVRNNFRRNNKFGRCTYCVVNIYTRYTNVLDTLVSKVDKRGSIHSISLSKYTYVFGVAFFYCDLALS